MLDRSKTIAATLQMSCARGDRILILCPPGLDYITAFFGCSLGGMVAVPAYPPRNAKHMQRLRSIIEDAGARAILAPSKLVDRLIDLSGSIDGIPQIIAVDKVDPAAASAWQYSESKPDDLVFLQYTSGTTGAPKGVMVSQRSLFANLFAMETRWRFTSEDVGVFWIPPFHDMGLLAGLVLPLYCGFPAHLMSSAAFAQRPLRWIEALSKVRATFTSAPNFAYVLAADGLQGESGTAFDLSHLRVSANGSELVRPQTLKRFAAAFAPFGFDARSASPAYGMAEITLMATGCRVPRLPRIAAYPTSGTSQRQLLSSDSLCFDDVLGDLAGKAVTSCGPVIDGHVLKIVDPEAGIELMSGEVGEIWLSGPSVAAGYWEKPELSREVFGARLAGSPEGPCYLRTGDLGAVMDGELYVLGRIKEMVIVRGRNHYAQDLEECVSAADAFLGNDRTIAFGVEHEAGEALVLVHELTRSGLRELDAPGIAQAVRRALLEAYEIDLSVIVFVKPVSLPRTTSGKLQRRRARDLFLASELTEVARWEAPTSVGLLGAADGPTAPPREWRADELEAVLREEIGAAIGVASDRVPFDVGFAELGLDSLRAIQLVNRLGESLGVHIDASDLYDTPTIAALAIRLSGKAEARPMHKPDVTAGSEAGAIAIIGMGMRFPGEARGAGAFWELLKAGRSGIAQVRGRWRLSKLDESDAALRASVGCGGFIEEIDRFDAGFFQIAPVEAMKMDPQQRLVLETSWAALEDAGVDPRQLMNQQAGVFLGISTSDYAQILTQSGPGEADLYTGIGSAQSVAAGRVSYFLGLQGPAVAVDTACSSSLVAVDQACDGLRLGKVDLALAGGVNAILTPDLSLAFARARMLSPDGRCKTFDASADGYVRGEGCGIVVLKRLSDAERDGDRI
ncbi:MAG: beta-ketoacyl synthase N-terminal-like domain-containing protein, partial [Aestuariivirga sp.]|uniref:beta-ketoacyl synthase N-terminal-like domain-containing protein n=1 Tax=Aestuariivirga sp. TaxID=2650926 RepID=UPI00301AF3CF